MALMKRTSIVPLAVVASVGLGVSQAGAALLAEESFSYAEGDLAGNGPGNGFGANTWAETDALITVAPGSLNFTSGPYTAGNRAQNSANKNRATLSLDASAGGTFGSAGVVDGLGNIGADGTTIYISYMMQVHEVKDYIGLEGYRDGNRAWFLGRSGNDARLTEGLTLVDSFGTVVKSSEDLYVLKIDFLNGGDRVTGWLSPTPGDPAPTADFANVMVGDFSFDQVAIWDNAAGNIAAYFDEIRIGTTYEAVTSDEFVAVVPEPASLALLATGGVLIASRRRA